jgi:O-antigen ligase
MPPALAAILCVGFVVYLFRRDIRQNPNVTGALWIPLIWLFIITSRFVSAWLDIVGLHVGGQSMEEGSPADALVSLVLILAGLWVLVRRGFRLSEFIRYNRWLTFFLLYCFLAVFWSDFMFVSFKRWFKILGQPIMVLVLFTEPDFETALVTLLKRCAYLVVPVSILFIKYFPELGRGFSEWTGQPFNKGITLDKNALGTDCLIFGFFFVWYLLKVVQWEKGKPRRNELILCAGFLGMIWWLLGRAQSSTSLVTLLIGVLLLVVLGMRWCKREYVGTWILLAIAVCAGAEYLFGISDLFFQVLGKDRTLTDRTLVWHDCLSIPINPIIGVGFESFWLGERQEIMNSKWGWHPNEAHNGYLEAYLNLGLIGLGILLALLLATFWKARRELLANFHFGRFRVAFLCALLIYNWTESSFKALHPMWFIFYIIALDYPAPEPAVELESELEPATGLRPLPPLADHRGAAREIPGLES